MAINSNNSHAIWAIVPAAGIGNRMQTAIPKQYLLLHGIPILAHTINRLLSFNCINGLVVALQKHDPEWDKLPIKTVKPMVTVVGGEQRCDSVLNALNCLPAQENFNPETDWVMVHDAVRPCLRHEDINRLITEVKTEAGGLLAIPVRDTMKRQRDENQSIAATVERNGLWHALTPQYFPWKNLRHALQDATAKGRVVTDEASAMEQLGYSPLLVNGHEDNIKITRPDDLQLAELYLSHLPDCHFIGQGA